MATFHGKDGVVKIGGTALGEVRSFSCEQSASTADDTVMGDSWDTHQITRNSWTASIECYWNDTVGAGGNATALLVGTNVTVSLYPEGASGTDYELEGSATVETVSTSQSHDGIVEVSFTCKGNGALVIGVG